MNQIVVVGASGFVGSTLVEHLLRAGHDEVRPLIHSSGNAWRVARLGVTLHSLDLLNYREVEVALRGATHVVNCSRGGPEVMLRGLEHLLRASRSCRVERFVHLSSVLVYGDPPRPSSSNEDAPTRPEKGTYGWIKLLQDRMIQKADVPSLILCPPNISGPYSPYLTSLVSALRRGTFALTDGGRGVCNVVDISNLVSALMLALDRGTPDGKRMFVTDGGEITWADLIARLMPLAGLTEPQPEISRETLLEFHEDAKRPRLAVTRALRHLASNDVREVLRRDPLWRAVERSLRRGVAILGTPVEKQLRGWAAADSPGADPRPERLNLDRNLCLQQLRGVRHRSDLLRSHLGWTPRYSFSESMTAFVAWYRSAYGMDSNVWELLRVLD